MRQLQRMMRWLTSTCASIPNKGKPSLSSLIILCLRGGVSHLIICCNFQTHGSSTHSTHQEQPWPTPYRNTTIPSLITCASQYPLAFRPSSTFTAKHVTTTPTKVTSTNHATKQPSNHPSNQLNKSLHDIILYVRLPHPHPLSHPHTHSRIIISWLRL